MTDPDIVRYYESFDENSRLTGPWGEIEFTRTVEMLARHLPAAPSRVLDIGGGTGPYSEALAIQGYEVHLLDPVATHVEAALRRPGIASAGEGDARALPWPDNFSDAVLLMGPLYHLCAGADRIQALRESRRVLKPGGVIAVAAISRFASLLDGLHRGSIDDPRFQPIVLEDLITGNHRNTTGSLDYFTTAYFHRPEELANEMMEAGFSNLDVCAVEGPVWVCPDLEQRWGDPVKKEFLLEMLRRIESEPALLGASPHLLAFARR